KADRFSGEKAFRFVAAGVTSPRYEKAKLAIAAKLDRLNREAKSFPFPTRPGKKQRNLIRFQLKFGTCRGAQLLVEPKSIERHTCAHDFDFVRRIFVKLNDLTLHHFRIRDDPACTAFGEKRSFQRDDVIVLSMKAAHKS